MAFDFGAVQWKSFDMPCPLFAAAISAAGNLCRGLHENAAGQVEGISRRAGNFPDSEPERGKMIEGESWLEPI